MNPCGDLFFTQFIYASTGETQLYAGTDNRTNTVQTSDGRWTSCFVMDMELLLQKQRTKGNSKRLADEKSSRNSWSATKTNPSTSLNKSCNPKEPVQTETVGMRMTRDEGCEKAVSRMKRRTERRRAGSSEYMCHFLVFIGSESTRHHFYNKSITWRERRKR